MWVADITSFELDENKKVYVFLCIDIFSNKILVSIFKTKTITSNDIVKKLLKYSTMTNGHLDWYIREHYLDLLENFRKGKI